MEAIMDMFGVKKYNPYKKKLLQEFGKEYLLRWYVVFGITLLAFVSGIFVDPSTYFVLLVFSVIPTSCYSLYLPNAYDRVEYYVASIPSLLLLIGFLSTILVILIVYQENYVIPEAWISYARWWAAIPLIVGSFFLSKRLIELNEELRKHGKGKTRTIQIYRFIGGWKK